MNLQLKNIKEFSTYLKDPLYKNSFFIMLSSLLNAGIGFIFWIIAARFYSSEYVGIGTALVSAMNIIYFLSILGFDQSLIKFFPIKDKSTVFNTFILSVSLSSLFFAIIFLLGIDIWAPTLTILKDHFSLFILFTIASTVTYLSGVSLIALRKGNFYFLQNILMSSRIILLIPLALFGALGIFYSIGISYILTFLFSLIIVFKFGIKFKKPDLSLLNDSFNFSVGNYFISLFNTIPGQILSIMVLNLLGASETAYYYIAFTLASLLFVIPTSFSTSLFVEGSHGEPLRKNVLKTLISIFGLLTVGLIFLLVFGKSILGFIGNDYINGFELLIAFSISSFFIAIYYIYLSIMKIQNKVKSVLPISGLISFLLISLSYIFINWYGLIGIGYAWIIGFGLGSLIIFIKVKNEKWFSR